jgi:hypothetical protein
MSEPTSTGSAAYVVVGGFIAVLGPVLGPFAMLLFAAAMGALLAMGKAGSMTRWQGAAFVFVSMAISLALTGVVVFIVEKYTPIPGNLVLMPIAFVFAAGREFLLDLVKRIFGAAGTFFEALASRGGGGGP